MGILLGIDIGGSTTKIVAVQDKNILATLQVKATDQVTSLYGAIGRLLYENQWTLAQVERIVLTGVGASWVTGDVYGIPTGRVEEFQAIGRGGLMLCNTIEITDALVVSMGTGTAFVRASKEKMEHIGGSGVGGGTLLGMAEQLLHEDKIEAIHALAEQGDLLKVDLTIGDISREEIPSLPADTTAANFGNVSPTVSKEDLALGLLNTVFQTIGMMAVFACNNSNIKDIIVTGSMATLPKAKEILDVVSALHHVRFHIPENAAFATAIGAAMLG